MLGGLMKRVKSAITHPIQQYVFRALAAIPLLIGVGYALAGVTTILADLYGSLNAYWIMAGAMSVLSALCWLAIVIAEKREQDLLEEKDARIERAAVQALINSPRALHAVPGEPATPTASSTSLLALVALAVMLGSVMILGPGGRRHSF